MVRANNMSFQTVLFISVSCEVGRLYIPVFAETNSKQCCNYKQSSSLPKYLFDWIYNFSGRMHDFMEIF